MRRDTMRASSSRRRYLGSAALALAVVTVIGATSIAPAKADWRDRGWHRDGGVGFGFSISGPGYYGYYPYPAYPAYPAYDYGYPYYYGPAYGPSFSVHIGGH